MSSSCGRDSPESDLVEKLRPSRIQLSLLSKIYGFVSRKLSDFLLQQGLRATVEPEGSFAKGTMLSDRWELDIFVIFDGVSRDWINSNAKQLLQEALRGLPTLAKYSEHPYITVSLMGVEVDVVPIASLGEGMHEFKGVERTPLHTRYVRSKLEQNPCLADDVRLLKSFLRGIGAYGAEAHVGGFSGYLAELLTIKYGGFREVLRAAAAWRPPVVLSIEGETPEDLRGRYPDSQLIVSDPVDRLRNAAAAVTSEKLSTFILASKLYLARPRREFFHLYSSHVPLEELGLPVYAVLVICSGDYSSTPPTDLWGSLAKTARSLAHSMAERGFTVIKVSEYTDEYRVAAIGVTVLERELHQLERVRGPPPWSSDENVLAFASKRAAEGGVVLSGERLTGLRRRHLVSAVEAAADWANKNARPCRVVGVGSVGEATSLGSVGEWASRELLSVPAWTLYR